MTFHPARGNPLGAAFHCALALVMAGVLPTVQRSLAAQGAVPSVQTAVPYIVGTNDLLAINVFEQPQLTGKYLVQADGTVTFPLLGRVKVGGLGMQEIENTVRERLAEGYLKNPQVSVTVEQYRSQQIIVIGEVRNPGQLEFTGPMTLISALARTGSTTEKAAFDALVIRPRAGGAPVLDRAGVERAQQKGGDTQIIQIDLEGLQSGALSQNLVLQGGDTVFVPKAATVFVSGQVVTPGEYAMRKGMTVRQVLAVAGGVTERGSDRRIQVIRKVDGKDQTLDIKLQDQVQAADTIVVRERFF